MNPDTLKEKLRYHQMEKMRAEHELEYQTIIVQSLQAKLEEQKG